MFDVNWPAGARCVVGITVDSDGPCSEIGRRLAPLGARAHGRYSGKGGIQRYLDLFRSESIPATFYVCGNDAERWPDLITRIAREGHEVGAHGYMHENFDLGSAEPALLAKTHHILTRVTGAPPRGWRSPGGRKTALTLRTLQTLGYCYDSSEKDHDYPYLCLLDGEPMTRFIELPNNTSSLDDFPFYRVSYTPPSEVLAHWIEEFDAIHREGGYFNLTVHPRLGYGSGSPARAGIVGKLIRHIRQQGDARFMRMIDIAAWCLENPDEWRLGGERV